MTETRLLWGIEQQSEKGDKLPLLFEAWHKIRAPWYEGEPTRPLLFWRRKEAREWCKQARAKHDDWKFREIRVEESWKTI